MEVFDGTRNFLHGIFSQDSSFNVFSVLTVFVVCLFYWNFRRFHFKSFPPGPMGLPIVGYHPFLGIDPHITLNNLSKKYGNVFSLKLGQSYVVVCNDWESKIDAFNKPALLNRPHGLFDAIPNGLGISGNNGIEWTGQRKLFVRIMKELGLGKPVWEEMLQAEIKEVISRIQNSKNNLMNVDELFSECFTNTMIGLVLGHHPNNLTSKYISERMDTIMTSVPGMAFRNYSPNLCSILAKMGLYGSSEALTKMLEFTTFVEDIVKEELQDDVKGNSLSFVKMYFQEVENNRKQYNSFTESNLYANAQALLLGGVDTTKDTASWLLAAMADFQEVQSKVHQELDSVVGRDGKITWSMRTELPYTFACVYEVLRWKTLAPINPLRMTSEDTKILGFDVPKGTIIIANNWALHNDRRYWPDPEKFEPERFLQEGGRKVNTKHDSFSPFSQGRRNCPGEQLALVDILLFFASIMQKFRILPEDGRGVQCETVLGMTYKPIQLKLRFISRE